MDPAEAAAMGLVIPDPAPLVFDMHPDAEEAIGMWFRICTQWRVTSGQRIGLDYGVLLGPGGLFSLYQVADPRGLLEDLQVMEEAALTAMARKD